MGGDEGELREDIEAGAKIRVTADVTVHHVPKQPTYSLKGKEGTVTDVVSLYKGKQISANLPYKCLFLEPQEDGKDKKIIAHLVRHVLVFVLCAALLSVHHAVIYLPVICNAAKLCVCQKVALVLAEVPARIQYEFRFFSMPDCSTKESVTVLSLESIQIQLPGRPAWTVLIFLCVQAAGEFEKVS